MFGYVAANPDNLTAEQKKRYRALYCGLCTALGKIGNNVYKAALSYDLVFAIMLISSVTGQSYEESERRCALHPSKKHAELHNEVTAYCADMNLLLAYYKNIDDVNDESSVTAAVGEKLMRKGAAETEKKYPEKCGIILNSLKKINEAEKANILNPDIPAGLFGEIMAQVLMYDNSEKCRELYDFGVALGRAVYVLDAAVDLKSDIKHGRYNPLVRFSSKSTDDILNMLLGCAYDEYVKLNITVDNEIIENILLSGVWMKLPQLSAKENDDDN